MRRCETFLDALQSNSDYIPIFLKRFKIDGDIIRNQREKMDANNKRQVHVETNYKFRNGSSGIIYWRYPVKLLRHKVLSVNKVHFF